MSVPLGTMLRFRNFGVSEFQSIKSRELRTKVLLPKTVQTEPNKTRLEAVFGTKAGVPQKYQFILEMTHMEVQTKRNWLGHGRKETGNIFSCFRLRKDSVETMEKLQKEIHTIIASHEGCSLSVSSLLRPTAKGEMPESIRISIFLQMNADEDYITLVNNATLKIPRSETNNKPSNSE
jgi:hypothetical protein